MRIETHIQKGIRVVDLPDAIPEDTESTKDARESLANALGAGPEPVVLNLHDPGPITAVKLGVLVGVISQVFRQNHDRFALVSVDKRFAGQFDNVPRERLFEHFSNVDEAICYLTDRFLLEVIPKPFRRPRAWFSVGGEVEIKRLRSRATERIRFSEPFGRDVIDARMRKGMAGDVNCFLFDFCHINVLSALFVGTMVTWKKLAEDNGARIAFFGMSDDVRASLARTQFADFFAVFDSRDKALEFLER
jgi:anti-anti-sigma regulatory factor